MRAVAPTCRICCTRATAALPWSGRARATSRPPQRYPVKITVFCDDRTGMLKELTAAICDETPTFAAWSGHDEDGEAIINFVVEAEDVRHLNRMVLALRRIDGVRRAEVAEGLKAVVSGQWSVVSFVDKNTINKQEQRQELYKHPNDLWSQLLRLAYARR